MSLLHLEIPAVPVAIADARKALDVLAPRVGPQHMMELRLLVSEVVTNAIRHAGCAAGAHVILVVDDGPGYVRIAVYDEGVGFDAPLHPSPRGEGTSGWGLFLVEKLAQRWGTTSAPNAHVWFELATP